MKKIILITLSLLMLTEACMSLILLIRYEVNKEYIAAFLCENRDKPEMHCGGKCQLKKSISTQERFIQGLAGMLNETLSVLAIVELFDMDFSPSLGFVRTDGAVKAEDKYVQDYHEKIFHPPSGVQHV